MALIHLKFVCLASSLAIITSFRSITQQCAQQEQPLLLQWATSIDEGNSFSLVQLLFIYLPRAASKPNTFNLAHLLLTRGQLGQLQRSRLFLQ